jgi:hypothetical protein
MNPSFEYDWDDGSRVMYAKAQARGELMVVAEERSTSKIEDWD